MATGIKIQGVTEFNRTLNRYMQVTSRDLATVLNTKAFYIARRATIETPKASSAKIRQFASGDAGRIIAMLINKRRGERGEKGLYGKEMRDAVLQVRAARLRSVAFLKSGWLPAIRKLQPLAARIGGSTPRQDRTARQIGRPKGEATPARGLGQFMTAKIVNAAGDNRENKGALLKYGLPALERAFAFETASMDQYITRKMQQSAKEQGIRTR